MKYSMMRYLTSLLCLFGLFASMTSCYYDNPPIEIDDVSFNDDVIPIFETSCLGAGCHQDGGPPPVLTAERAYDALINGSTPTGIPYVIVATPNESALMMELDRGEMPPAGNLPQLNIEQIRKWMQEGAEDN